MKSRIYFIRHGETDYNVDHRFQGSTDIELNVRGRKQIACLEKPMKNIHIDKVYSSPYMRTMETAQQVCSGKNLPIIEDYGLCEINCGQWEGLIREQIECRWPGMIDLWENKPDQLHMPDGETFQQVQDRAVASIIRIIREEQGNCVAIVTHMLTIQLIMARLLHVPIKEVWQMTRLENSSITTIDFLNNHTFKVIKWGDDSHLPEDLKNPYVKIAGFIQTKPVKYDISFVEGEHHFEM